VVIRFSDRFYAEIKSKMVMLDFESDQFMQLLTDALRQGPASPAWHEASARLKEWAAAEPGSRTFEKAEEFRLLLAARQHLESGRSYREIRAGSGFTRKVLESLEQERELERERRPSLNSMILAIIGALLAIAAVGMITYFLASSGPAPAPKVDLQNLSFPAPILAATFHGQTPAGWRTFGSLTPTFDGTFLPPQEAPANYTSCGLATLMPLPAGRSWQMEVQIQLANPSESVIPQIFVTDRADFDQGVAGTHELLCVLQPTNETGWVSRPQVVLPDGTASVGSPIGRAGETLSVGVVIDGHSALVECNQKRLYSGPSQLDPQLPKFAGVRFLRRGNLPSRDIPGIVSIRIDGATQ
jgi:hypothetical protein